MGRGATKPQTETQTPGGAALLRGAPPKVREEGRITTRRCSHWQEPPSPPRPLRPRPSLCWGERPAGVWARHRPGRLLDRGIGIPPSTPPPPSRRAVPKTKGKRNAGVRRMRLDGRRVTGSLTVPRAGPGGGPQQTCRQRPAGEPRLVRNQPPYHTPPSTIRACHTRNSVGTSRALDPTQ